MLLFVVPAGYVREARPGLRIHIKQVQLACLATNFNPNLTLLLQANAGFQLVKTSLLPLLVG